jgi:hypothetical protein
MAFKVAISKPALTRVGLAELPDSAVANWRWIVATMIP